MQVRTSGRGLGSVSVEIQVGFRRMKQAYMTEDRYKPGDIFLAPKDFGCYNLSSSGYSGYTGTPAAATEPQSRLFVYVGFLYAAHQLSAARLALVQYPLEARWVVRSIQCLHEGALAARRGGKFQWGRWGAKERVELFQRHNFTALVHHLDRLGCVPLMVVCSRHPQNAGRLEARRVNLQAVVETGVTQPVRDRQPATGRHFVGQRPVGVYPVS